MTPLTPEQLLEKLHEIDTLKSAYPYAERERTKLVFILQAIERGEIVGYDNHNGIWLTPSYSEFLKKG